MSRLSPFTLTGLIFLGIFVFLLWQRHSPKSLKFDVVPTSTVVASPSATLKTFSISFPSLNIYDLPIVPGIVTATHWDTTPNGVSYLSTSPLPGDVGNSIMYGHNWPNLLGNLVHITPGSPIIVRMPDGSVRNFAVLYTATVTPDQSSVLEPSTDSRLTIYTCTGLLDTKRFVAVATPIDSVSRKSP